MRELKSRIRRASKGWLVESMLRTASLKAAGRSTFLRPNWGKIKQVYLELQHYKCGYCERKLGQHAIEHDLEHFRPRGEVRAWPPQDHRCHTRYGIALGGGLPRGYYLLAYTPHNYLASCKTCNTVHKGSYFPVSGPRVARSRSLRLLRTERPLLIYPIGQVDDDPEAIITFFGIMATAQAKRGFRRQRALVTIDFFDLNLRDDLLRERAEVLMTVRTLLRSRRRFDISRVARLLDGTERHTNCARSFVRIASEDPRVAQRLADAAEEYWLSNDYPSGHAALLAQQLSSGRQASKAGKRGRINHK